MGGGTDVDAAIKWMINRSGGGDFVVIRATGTNAYNSYIYGLGGANSVETFLVASVAMANDSAIVQAVRKAEAIFFAGGNQNDYISYYKGTALGTVFDYLANVKHAPIGGTSAGCAIQGYIYYDGITNVLSPDALSNPYASGTGIHYNDFLKNPFLTNTICDTHFLTKGGTTSNGITGRQGRLMTFLARMIKDQNLVDVKGIACAEATAVCIDENGIGMVVGSGKAFFLKEWCASPETCLTGVPLTWNSGAKVYVVNGPGNITTLPAASKSVNLTDWTTVAGGAYEYWTVNNGLLTLGQTGITPTIILQPASAINCGAGIVNFSISANGNTSIAVPLNYQWLENGIPITNGATPNGIYSGAVNNTLTISSPNVSLNGKQYSCIVGQCGADTSIVATLTIVNADDSNYCTNDYCNTLTGAITHALVYINDNDTCTADACNSLTGDITHEVTTSSPSVTVTNNCGYSVLTASGYTGSLYWSNNSTLPSFTVLSADTFYVTQTVNGCTSNPANGIAFPKVSPSVYLGVDVVLGTGSVFQLDAGHGFAGYLWSTGDTTQTISVQTSNAYSVAVTATNGCTASDTIIVSFANGIIDNIFTEGIDVFPNPADNSLFLEFDRQENDFQIEVFNAIGQKQKVEVSLNLSERFKEVDISLLPTGIYSIVIFTDKGKRTGVFVKE